MVKEEDFNQLLELCSKSWTLDKELLKSITGMQVGRWMIKESDFTQLLELCSEVWKGLDKELLKSITGMQNGRWMIKESDFLLFINSRK